MSFVHSYYTKIKINMHMWDKKHDYRDVLFGFGENKKARSDANLIVLIHKLTTSWP